MYLGKACWGVLLLGVVFSAGSCSKENTINTGSEGGASGGGETVFSVGPSGGWIRGEGLDLYFPEDNTGEDLRITIEATDGSGVHDGDLTFHGEGMEPYDGERTALSPVYQVGPGNRDWDLPITVVVDLDPPVDDTSGVVLLWTDGDGAWLTVPYQIVDSDSIAADTTRLGYFVAVRQTQVACDPTVQFLNAGATACWPAADFCPCGTDGGSLVGRWEVVPTADGLDPGCESVSDEDWCLGVTGTSESVVREFWVQVYDDNTMDLSWDTTKTLLVTCTGTDGMEGTCTDVPGGPDLETRTCTDNGDGTCDCVQENPPEVATFTGEPYALGGKKITFLSDANIEAQAMAYCVRGDEVTLYAPEGKMIIMHRVTE